MALKGGRADTELRKVRKQKRLRAPLQLPLFTSPLEADPAGTGKVSGYVRCSKYRADILGMNTAARCCQWNVVIGPPVLSTQ